MNTDKGRARQHQPDWETKEFIDGETSEDRHPESPHHQPDWETNEFLLGGETNKLETSREPDDHQPDWETNESLHGETNEFETSGEPDTTSQTGRRMNCYMGRQMNWRHPESRTPPARLGDK